MTSKDLNLTLNKHLGEETPGKLRPQPAKSARIRPGPASPGAANSAPARKAGRRQAPANNPLVAFMLVIMLANILVLAAGAYWLYFNFERISAAAAPAQAIAPPSLDPTLDPVLYSALEGSLELLDSNIAALDARLVQLQVTVGEQQLLTTSAFLDLQEQLSALQSAKTAATGSATAGALAAAQVADKWVINASTFSTAEAAQPLVQQLTQMGYEARVGAAGSGDKRAHRVQLTGFAERAAAEEAARKIVEQTDLNGLWVWKDD